ncbi:glycosyltransferase family 2 protein [Parasporobacterium paucivorans]
MPSLEILDLQRVQNFNFNPKISLIVPAYKTPEQFLREMIDSVISQTYSNWELCIADGSGGDAVVEKVLKEYCLRENRIKYVILSNNMGISENTNEALKLASGEFIALMDHDDILTPNALFEVADCLNNEMDIDIVYSDEDKVSFDLKKYFQPHFKADFNIDLFRTCNYINHLFVVRSKLLGQVGGFNREYEGAQDYDLMFRCIEAAGKIHHIPKILYHWRSHSESTAENPESKKYAFEAGKRAIQAHYDRVGIKAYVENGPLYGLYHTVYKRDENPLISIIIPNKDHRLDLDKCLSSLFNKSTYKNYECVIVENNSTESETFRYYEDITRKYDNVSVVVWNGEFDYSGINNYGVTFAKGEYLLFLNNDIEIINEDCLEEMLGYCMRGDVGVVGARLFYPNDTIQHAGVIIGFGGSAGSAFVGQGRYDYGYFARAMSTQDYSAVTAACMMTKKSVFNTVCGFSRELKVAFNDIDYCLKVRKLGKLVVYNPYAQLYHYESKSRGLEDTPEKMQRFKNETEILRSSWKEIFEKGDPYYNPNLSLERFDFSLKPN